MNTIIINKIMMHMLDFEHRKIYLSEDFCELNDTTQEYYHKKVEKALYSPAIKELVVPSLHELLLRADKMLEDDEEFKKQAKEISEKFFALGSVIEEMPNSNILYVDCYRDGVHIIAALKLNYKYNSVSLVEEKNVRITRRQVLPQIGTAVDEAIIIDTDHKKLSLIEKKYLIDGKMDTYLNSQWIKGEEKLTDRQKISTMKKVVNKIDDIYHVNDKEALPLVKQEILERTQMGELVKPIEVVRKVMERDYQAQEESETMMKDLGIGEDDTISLNALGRSVEVVKITLDENIQITMPVDEYVNGSTFEKKENPDGTVSIVLNNIQDITIK